MTEQPYLQTRRHCEPSVEDFDKLVFELRDLPLDVVINILIDARAPRDLDEIGEYFYCPDDDGDTDDERNYRCEGCRVHDGTIGPMLHDKIWAAIARGRDLLCLDCMQESMRTAFNRRLAVRDLTEAPLNAGYLETAVNGELVRLDAARVHHSANTALAKSRGLVPGQKPAKPKPSRPRLVKPEDAP